MWTDQIFVDGQNLKLIFATKDAYLEARKTSNPHCKCRLASFIYNIVTYTVLKSRAPLEDIVEAYFEKHFKETDVDNV